MGLNLIPGQEMWPWVLFFCFFFKLIFVGEGIKGYGPGSPSMSVSLKKGQKPGGCSGYEPACLGSPSLVLESQRAPGELLVFSQCWNPEEVGSDSHEGVPQQWDR